MKTGIVHAATFVPRHRLLLLSIGATSEKVSTYDAVRFAWKLSPARAREAELVLAHVKGLVVGVFTPTKWMEATK